MSIKDALKQRRSIRKYTSQPVPDTLVMEVLEAASFAPSAHNSQPWRFIILKDDKVKRELAEQMAEAWAADLKKDGATIEKEKFIERRDRFANAPVLILACLTMEGLRTFPEMEKQQFERDLAVESLGAGLENLLLAAHAVGLGACWFCAPAFCKQIVRKLLKIPDSVEPSALVLMGYPAETPVVPRRKRLEEYCYRDIWGKPV
ncbi:MAG: nitroreductase family protein [Candidatus Bathyarchaeia archaeon]|jgi:F420 biosynthesis protein FbiB-like protein